MSDNSEQIKLLKKIGIILIGLAVVGFLFFGNIWLNPKSWAYIFGQNPPSEIAIWFVTISTAFYLIAGMGILRFSKWGYFLFKFILYTLVLAFPVGTIISYKTLNYLKKHQVKKYFGFVTS